MSTTFNEITRPATILHAEFATQPATVLLAEDDRALRRYLEVTLQRAGYRVLTAADGLEAMKALLTSEVDALVTDAVMPHLGGHELCRFLRSHPKLSALPVVLLSGSNQIVPTHGDTEGRADIYLSKPVRTEELTNCVGRMLSHVAA